MDLSPYYTAPALQPMPWVYGFKKDAHTLRHMRPGTSILFTSTNLQDKPIKAHFLSIGAPMPLPFSPLHTFIEGYAMFVA